MTQAVRNRISTVSSTSNDHNGSNPSLSSTRSAMDKTVGSVSPNHPPHRYFQKHSLLHHHQRVKDKFLLTGKGCLILCFGILILSPTLLLVYRHQEESSLPRPTKVQQHRTSLRTPQTQKQASHTKSHVFPPKKRPTLTGQATLSSSTYCQTSSSSCPIYYPLMDLSNILLVEEAATTTFLTERPPASSSSSSTASMDVPNPNSYPSNVAILTRRGYKGGLPSQQVNQDRAFFASLGVQSAATVNRTVGGSKDDKRQEEDEEDFVMGILDGHGELGHEVSHQVVQMFPEQLIQQLEHVEEERRAGKDSYPSWIPFWKSKEKDALHKENAGSVEGDREDQWIQTALETTFQMVDQSLSRDIASQAGCTASIVLRKGSKLYVAKIMWEILKHLSHLCNATRMGKVGTIYFQPILRLIFV